MELHGEFKPLKNFTPTELRLPGIKEYLHQTIGKDIEDNGFTFKKSDFTFKRKHNKSYEQIMFLFYNYHPLHYSFDFLLVIYNDQIELIKQSLPAQQHWDKNTCTLLLRTVNFTNHSVSVSYPYEIATLDNLIVVTDLLRKAFIN
ncbi:MAG TPA: hypothetical protein VHA52_11450, partial [Candidatus Babeliaceae bacterium]|nr:hypothetical protein [Candidatus Babeliaceae bacterium]